MKMGTGADEDDREGLTGYQDLDCRQNLLVLVVVRPCEADRGQGHDPADCWGWRDGSGHHSWTERSGISKQA